MLASPASSSAVTNSRYYPHSSPPMPIPSFLPATSRSGRSSLSDSHEPSWLYVLPRLETNAVAQRPSYDWQRSHPMRNSTYSHRGPPSPPSDASSSLRDSTSPTTTGGMTAVTEASVDASARCSTKTNFAGSADTTSTSIRLGRKRKRLQRACDPCHKAKRRCDGGLPCSNCDFSGRGCSYSDSQGNAVQPTARARPPTSKLNSPSAELRGDQVGRSSSSEIHFAETSRSSLSERVATHHADYNVSISAEHLSILQSIAPFNAILPSAYHPAHRNARSSVPSPLLSLAISALTAARLNRRHEATQLAASARRLLAEEDDHGRSLLDHPNAETILGLVILALEESSYGKLNRATAHSSIACRIIQDLNLPGVTLSDSDLFHPFELCRLVCVAFVADVTLSALAGRPSCISVVDLDIAANKVSQIAGCDSMSALFATLLRSTAVFARALEHQRRVAHRIEGSQTNTEAAAAQCHEALGAWANELPASLSFDDHNLARAGRVFNRDGTKHSDGGGELAWVWAFTLMHCFAEMAVCVLEAAAGPTKVRREAACSNLATLLLDTMDGPCRNSVLSMLPLLFAGQGPRDTSLCISHQLAESRRYNALDDDQIRRAKVFLGISVNSASYLVSSQTLSALPSSVEYRASIAPALAGPAPPVMTIPRSGSHSEANGSKSYDESTRHGVSFRGPRPLSTSPSASFERRFPWLNAAFNERSGVLPAVLSNRLPSMAPQPSTSPSRSVGGFPSLTKASDLCGPPSPISRHALDGSLSSNARRFPSLSGGSRDDSRRLAPPGTSFGRDTARESDGKGASGRISWGPASS